jgi:hypothetical protein
MGIVIAPGGSCTTSHTAPLTSITYGGYIVQ